MALPSEDQLAELGKVIMLASLLEWDLAVLTAQLADLSNEEGTDLLKVRTNLIRKFRLSIEEFEKMSDESHGIQLRRGTGDIRILDHVNFIEKIEAAFRDRDRVAHGIYLWDTQGQPVMYHPRKEVSYTLDKALLNEIAIRIDILSSHTASMARIIADRKKEMSKEI